MNTDNPKQLLTFLLADQQYAVEINIVNEVLEYKPVTKVPKTPPFLKGLLNLRGNVIPVVDLRLEFNMPTEQEERLCSIIILDIATEANGTLRIGALVDEVQAVLEVEADTLSPPPDIGFLVSTDLIKAVVKQEHHHLVILDMEKVLSLEQINKLSNAMGFEDKEGEPQPDTALGF